MVRSSSSTHPASSSAPLRRGPPSAWTNVGGLDRRSSSRRRARPGRPGRSRPARRRSARRRRRGRRTVLGQDQEAGAAGEQRRCRRRRRPVAVTTPMRWPGLARRAVALGARRAGADDDRRRRPGAGRRARRGRWRCRGRPSARRRRSSRRGWRSCTARPTAGRPGGGRAHAVQLVDVDLGRPVRDGCTPHAGRCCHGTPGRQRSPVQRDGPTSGRRADERRVAHTEIHRVVPLSPHRPGCLALSLRAGCGAARGSSAGPGGDGVGPRGPEPAMPHRAAGIAPDVAGWSGRSSPC